MQNLSYMQLATELLKQEIISTESLKTKLVENCFLYLVNEICFSFLKKLKPKKNLYIE